MKILVYPWDKNPYQKLLYAAVRRSSPGARVAYGFRFPFIWWAVLPLWLLVLRPFGYRIVHMHWAKLSFAAGPVWLRQWLTVQSYRFFLPFMKLLGYRTVWTVHNVLPHEPQAADDIALSRYIASHVDGKIVHTVHTVAQMEQIGMDTRNTVVIPHGNYDGVYPDTVTRAAARKRLGIRKDDRVILFFGKIRPYKGVDDLVAAFSALSLPHTRLVIAGQCDAPEIDRAIRAAQKHTAITYVPGHVADEDVAVYFKASDVVCLPFRSITTSGSALLALTFGKPVIAPRANDIMDMPEQAGYFYDPDEKDALQQALIRAASATQATFATKGAAARTYASTLDWDILGRQTAAFYESLLADKR